MSGLIEVHGVSCLGFNLELNSTNGVSVDALLGGSLLMHVQSKLTTFCPSSRIVCKASYLNWIIASGVVCSYVTRSNACGDAGTCTTAASSSKCARGLSCEIILFSQYEYVWISANNKGVGSNACWRDCCVYSSKCDLHGPMHGSARFELNCNVEG